METMMLNHNAAHQLLTVKPGTKVATHFTMMILMTNRNKPSVNKVMGMVSTMSMGFTKLLSKPSTTATNNTVEVPPEI